jgi:hypothetical protein
MRSHQILFAVGLMVSLAAGCGSISSEQGGGTGGSGAGGAGGGGLGGASGTCYSDSDCIVEQVGCCGGQICAAKGAVVPGPEVPCTVSCPIESLPVCACVNHQCINEAGTGGQSGGTGGAAGTGGAGGGASCGDLASEYAAALPAAEACDVNAAGTCELSVSSSLSPCFSSCMTYVNDATALNAIKAAWLQQKCNDVPVLCPLIACLQPQGGLCVAGDGGAGRCQSPPIGAPN